MPDGVQPSFPMRPIRGADDGTVPGGQGAEGQGTEGQSAEGAGLYDSILQGVPDEFHGPLTERLKAKDAELNKAHQTKIEAWKPYDELGIRDVEPEAIQGFLNLGNALEAAASGDAEAAGAIQEWWTNLGNEFGFNQSQEPEGEEVGDLLDLSPQKLEEMVGGQVAQAVTPIMQRLDQQEQERVQAEAQQEVADKLSALRSAHPNLTDADEKRILAFAAAFGQGAEDPVQAGFDEFKATLAQGESALLEQKLGQPAAAEGSGMANTTPPEITSANVKDLARERLRQAAGI